MDLMCRKTHEDDSRELREQGHIWNNCPTEYLSSAEGHLSAIAGRISMVPWFISPWEAARVYMEVQRLTVRHLFGFALPSEQPKEELPEEQASGEEKVSVRGRPSTATPLGDHLLTSSKPGKPIQKTAVAARSNTQTAKRATGTHKQNSRAGRRKR